MTKHEKELRQALKPLALFGLYIMRNPMLRWLNDNVRIGGYPMAPTVGDAKRAAKLFPEIKPEMVLTELKKQLEVDGRLCKKR